MDYNAIGRYVRIALGTALVLYGWYHPRSDIGVTALIVGLVAVAAGLLDFHLPHVPPRHKRGTRADY